MPKYLTGKALDAFLDSDKARQIQGLAWCHGFDNNQCKKEGWKNAPLRVLVSFLSTGPTRSVSNTYSMLDGLIRVVPDVFVDYSYYPSKEDLAIYDNYNIPFMFGNVSHRICTEYDLIIHSHSVLVEFINAFHLLDKSGIPVYHKDRSEPGSSYPLLIAGGIPIQDHDAMGGNSGIPDLIFSGQGEGRLTEVIEYLRDFKERSTEENYIKTPKGKKSIIKDFVTKYDSVYYPDGYTVEYDKYKIKKIKPRFSWVPEKVKFHSEFELDPFTGFENKIFTPDGSNATASDMIISAGCAGGMQCFFCEEGVVCGGWREKSIDRLRQSMDDTLIKSACNTISFYSFNLSYYSRFVDLIWEAARRFSKLSLINMRIDMIAEAPEYFDAAYALGIRRASAPIEGLGDRIRNKIFNKNLSREQIMKAFATFYSYGIMEVKCGMVLSGLETEEDIDDAISEFEEILEIRNNMGSTAGIRCNFTPLVVYPKTGLARIPQMTAYNSMHNKKTMKKFLDHFRGRIRCKFNGANFGTFIEQMTLNIGRLGTPIWDKIARQHDYHYYGSPGNEMPKHFIRHLAEEGYKPEDWFKRKEKGWVFPTSHIEAKDPDYQEKVFEAVGTEGHASCTKTPSNLHPKCYECGFCKTKEEKKAILTRKLGSEKTTTDIQTAMFENKRMSTTRVMYRVPKEAFCWSKRSFSHLIASKILQIIPDVSVFHSVSNYSSSALDAANMRDWVYGNFSFDINWKSFKPPEMNKKEANKLLDFVKIKEINNVGKGEKMPRTSIGVYKISSPRSNNDVGTALRRWVGKVKIPDKVMVTGYDVKFTTENLDRSQFKLFSRDYAGGSKMVLIAPMWVTPHPFYQTLFNTSYKATLKETSVDMFGLFSKEKFGGCRACKSSANMYHLTSKLSTLCFECIAKYLMKQ